MHLKDNKNDTFSKINYKAWLLIISKHFKKKITFFSYTVCLITLARSICCWSGRSTLRMKQSKYVNICRMNEFMYSMSVEASIFSTYLCLVFKCTLEIAILLFIYSMHHLHETLWRECTIQFGSYGTKIPISEFFLFF